MWRENPVFQRRKFLQGRQIRGDAVKDIVWLTPGGYEMQDSDWNAGFVRCLGVRLDGHMADEVDERGRPIVGNTMVMLLNAHEHAIPFTLPPIEGHEHWQPVLDSAIPRLRTRRFPGGHRYDLQARSLAVLQLKRVWPKFLAKLVHWLGSDT